MFKYLIYYFVKTNRVLLPSRRVSILWWKWRMGIRMLRHHHKSASYGHTFTHRGKIYFQNHFQLCSLIRQNYILLPTTPGVFCSKNCFLIAPAAMRFFCTAGTPNAFALLVYMLRVPLNHPMALLCSYNTLQ